MRVMEKIISFLKEHKDFISFIFKCWRGPVKLRAFNILIGLYLVLASGYGVCFHLDSTGKWSWDVSISLIGWGEIIFAILATIAFYIFLYWDNKSEFNNYIEDLSRKASLFLQKQEDEQMLPFYRFAQFDNLYNRHNVFCFEDTDELSQKRGIIINEKNINEKKHIRILALSGTGKTFLILQAFRESGNFENVFYCDSVHDGRFDCAVKYLALNKPNSTIILDNCPSNISNRIIEDFGNNFCVISIYFNPNDKDNHSNPIFFDNCGIPSIIDRIISNNAQKDMSDTQKEFIKYHSGGIPLMALLLTQAFNKNGEYSDIHDTRLMENLLDIEGDNKEEQRIAMRTIALFQPFDFDNAKSPCADFIINNDYFTPIVSQVNRTLLFRTVVDKLHKRNLIEKDSVFINMRPQPLACWLVGEWLREQGSFITQLFSKLKEQQESLYKPIVESIAKRLEFMQGNQDAKKLYEELLNLHDGPFCNEDVICSDFGSRLILAMCTVNSVAVVDCLYAVLYRMSIDSLRNCLKDDARRNIVRTLEKLCFCNESFEKAACLMARLAIAENEEWANNAHRQFLQLFHVALAGTESDFDARMNVLQNLYIEGDEYKPLLLEAIRGAFNYSNLVRMRGAEKFGFIEKLDFYPTRDQISDYWNNLYKFLIEWLEKEPELTRDVAGIVCYNTRMFIRSEKSALLFDFISSLAPKLNYRWNEMHKSLIEIKNYDKVAMEVSEQIDFWLKKLKPCDIINAMKAALHDMVTKNDYGSDIMQKEESIVLPFVQDFIEQKAYLTDEIFQLLDSNTEYVSWAFENNFAKLLPAEEISVFCNYIKDYIFQQDKNFYSPFLVKVLGRLLNKKSVSPFAFNLFEGGYIDLAVSIFGAIDDSTGTFLPFIMGKLSSGDINLVDVKQYLKIARKDNVVDIWVMAQQLQELGADESLLFDYISNYWYLEEIYKNSDLVNIYQEVILNYQLKDNDNFNYQYSSMVATLLQKVFDSEFAKSLNKKLIEYLSYNQSSFRLEEIYDVLLTDKYRKFIWTDFSEAFTDLDKRCGFFLNVRYAVGSGFGFIEKSLFYDHIEQMQDLCRDFKYGPFVCASTCPIFTTEDFINSEISSFHPFVIWLIENYGNQQSVLDEFHANLNTFSSSGSLIPLIEVRKRCFNSLKQKKNLDSKVYKWIDLCLKSNLVEYKREERGEAYMRLAYGQE